MIYGLGVGGTCFVEGGMGGLDRIEVSLKRLYVVS